MKKILTLFSSITIFATPFSLVSCRNNETRDRSRIALNAFSTELALIPVFDQQNNLTTVDEAIFQNALYTALETNEYLGDNTSNEINFTYYDENQNIINWQDLTFQTINSVVKTPLIYFSLTASDTTNHFSNSTQILATTLYRTQLVDLSTLKFTYDVNTLKTLISPDTIISYLAGINSQYFLSSRHITITKTDTSVILTALSTSLRYTGLYEIHLS